MSRAGLYPEFPVQHPDDEPMSLTRKEYTLPALLPRTAGCVITQPRTTGYIVM